MNYVVKPSLKHVALVKIAGLLWNQCDIRDLIRSFSFPSIFSKLMKAKTDKRRDHIMRKIDDLWDEVERGVEKKVAELPLPQLLKDNMRNFIRIVGSKIFNWMVFIYQSCDLKLSLPNEFHWTSKGTIDELKTAKKFIKDESVDIATRYKLSCIYCSKNDIQKLWNEMPEDRKKHFYSEEDEMHLTNNELVIFWTYNIKGEIAKLEQMLEEELDYEYALHFAVSSGNKVATEYFLHKLEPARRKQLLTFTAGTVAAGISGDFEEELGTRSENYSEILCILLSQMDKKQQMETFERKPEQVLYGMLEWPFQSFFMETANRMWNFLSEENFGDFLKEITFKMLGAYKDYEYKELFKQFWKQSPDSFKRYIAKELNSVPGLYQIMSNLFDLDDMDSIKLLYRDVTIDEKERIFYRDNSMRLCSHLISDKKWNLLKFYVTESLPTKNAMIKFKSDLEKEQLWTFKMSRKELQEFLDILNDLIWQLSKRKCLDNDNYPTKKHCKELKP